MRPVVGLYLISGNRLSYAIAKTLALGGCRVIVRSETSRTELADTPHPHFVDRKYSLRLFSDPDIEIISNVSESPTIDALPFEASTVRLRSPKELKLWIDQAAQVTAWNTGLHQYRFSTNLRFEVGILQEYWPFLVHAQTVVMSMGRLHMRPTAIFSKTTTQGYFVRPDYLSDMMLRREIFESVWNPAAPRKFHVLFSGAMSGVPDRVRIAKQIPEQINDARNVVLITEYDSSEPLQLDASSDAKLVLWLPTWPGQRHQITQEQWQATLRNCNFCVCPPGGERKTHRVIESLLQGAIPILDCLDEYDIGLKHGVHCLVVRNGDWAGAIRQAILCEMTKIVEMRDAIRVLVQRHLNEEAMAKRWLNKIGLTPRRPLS
jgi:hypothetical protein